MENLSYKNYINYKDEIPLLFNNFRKSKTDILQPYGGINLYFVKTNQFRNSKVLKNLIIINPKRN